MCHVLYEQGGVLLRNKRVKPLYLFVFLSMLVLCFILYNNQQKQEIEALNELAYQTRLSKTVVERERSNLQREVDSSDDNEYIVEKARSLYGYLSPGEIRFKVTNLDALYDTEPTAEIVGE